MQRTTALLIAAALIGAGLSAQDTSTPKREAQVERRAERQQKRIDAGVKSGKLTAAEAAKLEKREAKIDRHIAKAEADGKITKKEQVKLNAEQNRASGKIHQKKHNAKTQPK